MPAVAVGTSALCILRGQLNDRDWVCMEFRDVPTAVPEKRSNGNGKIVNAVTNDRCSMLVYKGVRSDGLWFYSAHRLWHNDSDSDQITARRLVFTHFNDYLEVG